MVDFPVAFSNHFPIQSFACFPGRKMDVALLFQQDKVEIHLVVFAKQFAMIGL